MERVSEMFKLGYADSTSSSQNLLAGASVEAARRNQSAAALSSNTMSRTVANGQNGKPIDFGGTGYYNIPKDNGGGIALPGDGGGYR